jgi:hypothetical protein
LIRKPFDRIKIEKKMKTSYRLSLTVVTLVFLVLSVIGITEPNYEYLFNYFTALFALIFSVIIAAIGYQLSIELKNKSMEYCKVNYFFIINLQI